jgi:hypothetical protein
MIRTSDQIVDARGPGRAAARRPLVGRRGRALCIAFSGILVVLAAVSPSTATYRAAFAIPRCCVGLVGRAPPGPRTRRQRTLCLRAGIFFAAT